MSFSIVITSIHIPTKNMMLILFEKINIHYMAMGVSFQKLHHKFY